MATTDTLTVPAETKDITALSPEQLKERTDALLPVAQALGERVVALRAQGVNVTDDMVTTAAERVATMPLYVGANAKESNEPLSSFVSQNLFTVDGKNASLNTSGLDALEIAIKNMSPENRVDMPAVKEEPLPAPLNAAVTNTNSEVNVDNSTNTTVIEAKKDEPPALPVQINTANTSLTTNNTETNIDNSTNTTVVAAPPVLQADSAKKDEPAPPVNVAAAGAEANITDSPNAVVNQTTVVQNVAPDAPASAPSTQNQDVTLTPAAEAQSGMSPASAAIAAGAIDIDNSPNATVHQTVILHPNAPDQAAPVEASAAASGPGTGIPHSNSASATDKPVNDSVNALAAQQAAFAGEAQALKDGTEDKTTVSAPTYRQGGHDRTAATPAVATSYVETDEFIQSNGGANFKIAGIALAALAAVAVLALGSFTAVAGVMLAGAAISYGIGKIKEVHDRTTDPVRSETSVTHRSDIVQQPAPELPQHDLGRSDGKSWTDVTPAKPSPAVIVSQPPENKNWAQATQDQATAQASVRI